MSEEQSTGITLEEFKKSWDATTCCECGIAFASPILKRRLQDGNTFYCPVGHSQYYIKPRREREQEEALEKMLMQPEPPKKKRWWKR